MTSILAASAGCGDDGASGLPEPEVHTAHINGLDLAYFERGSGPLVILLHGFPDTAHTWDVIAPRLAAAGYRVVTPFLRGYAPSGIPERDTTVEALGRDVLGLVDALEASRAIVIGHDWGAIAAYAAASLAPARVEKLVTLAIPHPIALFMHPELPFSPHFQELVQPGAAEMVRREKYRYLHELVARWSPTWKVPTGELARVIAAFEEPGSLEAALGYYRAVNAPLPPALFQPLSVPTLTLYGTEDHAQSSVPFADQRAAFTGPLQVVALPVGHFVHREAETDTLDQLLDFLGSPAAAAR